LTSKKTILVTLINSTLITSIDLKHNFIKFFIKMNYILSYWKTSTFL